MKRKAQNLTTKLLEQIALNKILIDNYINCKEKECTSSNELDYISIQLGLGSSPKPGDVSLYITKLLKEYNSYEHPYRYRRKVG